MRSSSIAWKSRAPTRKSCEIFSEYARSVEANGGASTSLQTTLPTRLGKNIAQTRRRSWHWRPSELLKPRQIRWYKNLSVAFPMLVIALSAFLSLASSPVLAQSPAAQRGLTFVRVHCAQCHAIDKVSDSPLAIAPPFRTLHLKFPLESLRRRLAEGIVADHPTMPQFRLDPDQIADVMAYLQTFEP